MITPPLQAASRVNSSAIQLQIPHSNVGELTILVKEGCIRSDIADVGPESSEIAVPVHVRVVVQILLRLMVELLRFIELPVGISILGDPNPRIDEPTAQSVSKYIL